MPDGPLYQRVLGPDWQKLDPAIRRMHSTERGLSAIGVFRVMHGRKLATRLLAKLLRLPAEAPSAAVRLEVTPSGPGEIWNRTFDGRRLNSRQYVAAPGVLREDIGWLAIEFRLSVEDGRLIYRQQSAGLRSGSGFVPLPTWTRPTVSATEAPDATTVTVTFPRIGVVLSYTGRIDCEEVVR